MSVSAVVVTYNRLALLKECLSDILSQRYKVDYVFIINNDSSDGTKKYLNTLHDKKVIVKNLDNNIGGAGGFSLGTKLAFKESRSHYFWLMDDDTMPTYNALYNMMSASKKLSKRNNIGFLCSNVRLWKNNKPVNVPDVTKDWTQLLPSNFVKVKRATFVSLLVSRKAVKKIGLPIADMFIWGDDFEYTSRIFVNHFQSYLISNSIVMHKSIENDGKETIYNTNRLNYYKFMFRNYMYNDRKYQSRKRFLKDIVLNLCLALKVLFFANNHRIKRFYCILKSTLSGICFNPKVKFPNDTF